MEMKCDRSDYIVRSKHVHGEISLIRQSERASEKGLIHYLIDYNGR
jgi:hypothetical protein